MDDGSSDLDWVGPLYDELLADMLLRRDAVEQDMAFLVRELSLHEGARVFDQGCGIGSLAVPLEALGMSVVGVDQCAAYVAQAQAAGRRAAFHVGDAWLFRPDAPVDGAFSWWTNWGHALDDASNLAMLRRVHDSPGPNT